VNCFSQVSGVRMFHRREQLEQGAVVETVLGQGEQETQGLETPVASLFQSKAATPRLVHRDESTKHLTSVLIL
jgi:hypothetical protein